MGRDACWNVGMGRVKLFQSTRPAWGATGCHPREARDRQISIHAPRMGRDLIVITVIESPPKNFNPRAPHGARRDVACQGMRSEHISIHAPRMGRDFKRLRLGRGFKNFNPRAPHGARPRLVDEKTVGIEFQSTRPAWGATRPDNLII